MVTIIISARVCYGFSFRFFTRTQPFPCYQPICGQTSFSTWIIKISHNSVTIIWTKLCWHTLEAEYILYATFIILQWLPARALSHSSLWPLVQVRSRCPDLVSLDQHLTMFEKSHICSCWYHTMETHTPCDNAILEEFPKAVFHYFIANKNYE